MKTTSTSEEVLGVVCWFVVVVVVVVVVKLSKLSLLSSLLFGWLLV